MLREFQGVQKATGFIVCFQRDIKVFHSILVHFKRVSRGSKAFQNIQRISTAFRRFMFMEVLGELQEGSQEFQKKGGFKRGFRESFGSFGEFWRGVKSFKKFQGVKRCLGG